MISRRAASEFPNDNPELHDGLVWACPETSGPALPTLRVRPVVGPLPRVLGPAWEAAELDAPAAPDAAEPPADGPFERFIAALSRVAMSHGATRAGAAVSTLLTEGRLASQGVDPGLLESLARRRILAPGGVHVSAEFAAATRAWRAVLEGTSADLSACGSATLDAWAADLLSAVMAAPQEAAELRRELRRTGVAAFGLLAVA